MGFLWFGRKKEEKLKEEIKGSFSGVKKDISKIGRWIRHLDERDDELEEKFDGLKQDIDEIKSFISFFNMSAGSRVFKQNQTAVHKQTAVQAVQTPVQTAVQSAIFNGFTTNERIIIWTLLNTEMKLSYDDIAVLLGKNKSTVRTQVNSIKQKNENLISEYLEKSGKKRHYIDGRLKEILLKKIKVRTQGAKGR